MSISNIHNLSDAELYRKCQEYGEAARMWRRKFAGLLPEVMRRKLYKRKGFASIHEFAGKLGGMSREAVDKVLRLGERLKDKPILRAQLESGSQGWSKIEKVAFIATAKTDKEWAEKVESLPKQALELYVREYKIQTQKTFTAGPNRSGVQNNSLALTPGSNFTDEEPWSRLSFPVSPEIEFKLRTMKQKLERERKMALSWNDVLKAIFKENEEKKSSLPQGQKSVRKIIPTCEVCTKEKTEEQEDFGVTARHIPAAVQHIIEARSGERCEFPGCNRPPEIFHHTRRYALRPNHDPDYIRALCKSHERIAHAGLIGNEEGPVSDWLVLQAPEQDSAKFRIDQKVTASRQKVG